MAQPIQSVRRPSDAFQLSERIFTMFRFFCFQYLLQTAKKMKTTSFLPLLVALVCSVSSTAVRKILNQKGVSANSPQPWKRKRKRNFWYAVMVKSCVCVCVSSLRALCTNSPKLLAENVQCGCGYIKLRTSANRTKTSNTHTVFLSTRFLLQVGAKVVPLNDKSFKNLDETVSSETISLVASKHL